MTNKNCKISRVWQGWRPAPGTTTYDKNTIGITDKIWTYVQNKMSFFIIHLSLRWLLYYEYPTCNSLFHNFDATLFAQHCRSQSSMAPSHRQHLQYTDPTLSMSTPMATSKMADMLTYCSEPAIWLKNKRGEKRKSIFIYRCRSSF